MSLPSFNMNPICFTNGIFPFSPNAPTRTSLDQGAAPQTPIIFNSPNFANLSYSSGYASSDSPYFQSPFNNVTNNFKINNQYCYQDQIGYNFHHINNESSPTGFNQAFKRKNKPELNHLISNIIYSQDPELEQAFQSNELSKNNKRSNNKKLPKLESEIDNFDEYANDNIDSEIDFLSDQNQSNSENCKKKRVLNKSQRVAANQRERKRMGIMNQSFYQLRNSLPISTGRKRRKMSRLDIVVGAIEYIQYLDELLKGDGPYEINFDAFLNSLFASNQRARAL